MILLIGASGLLGSKIGHDLQAKNIPFEAAGRSEHKLSKAYQNPPPFRKLDLFEPTNLDSVLEGITKIIVCVHALFGNGKTDSSKLDRDGIIKLVEVASSKNIEHFLLVSAQGAAEKHPVDFYENKFQSEKALKSSGIPYTILQPTAFMELHIGDLLGKGLVQKGKTFILGKGEVLSNYISVKDLALLITFLIQDSPKNESIEIGGPDNMSKNQIAAKYGSQLIIEPKISHVPISILKLISNLLLPFHKGLSRVVKMSIYMDSNAVTIENTNIFDAYGIKPMGIEKYIESHIKSLRATP
jgi:NADH dehydrogenase